jgi:NADPH2:quinone reductase
MMDHALRLHETGGPEKLVWESIALPPPGPGEVRLRHTAIGLNYIDVYHRVGLYPLPMPAIIGSEAAGVVEALGPNVSDFTIGQRVAYGTQPGSYTQARNIKAEFLVPLPDAVSDEIAATAMLKGMTARFLLKQTYPVKSGETILVHAAAGGVGQILCQWATALGATVIGTVGSEEKARIAKDHGCDFTIIYTRENFIARVKEITNGQGVPVVYDGVGASTFMDSLDCLQFRGLMVSYGNASGPVPPLNILTLTQKGSLYVTRPSLFGHVAKRNDLLANAADLFEAIASGKVKLGAAQRFALKDAGEAHRALEARATTGATVLIP